MNKKSNKTVTPSFTEYPPFFARFYDLIYHQVRDDVDTAFYLSRIINSKGRVMEVGTGTGRLFIKALEGGADIYGIDLSPAMLDILKAKLKGEDKKRISYGNIVDFRSDEKFDLIVAPFRVMMHLVTIEEQLKALINVHDNLNPGGQFIFDLFIPDLILLLSGMEDIRDFDGEYEPGNKVSRTVTSRADLINQTMNIKFLIEWNEGEKKFSGEWHSSLRYFFRFELEHLLERSPFRHYSIAGDFSGNSLSNNSREFIVTCTKEPS